jgi:hypothetical protein
MRVRTISFFLLGVVAMSCFVRPALAQDTLPTSKEKHGLTLYEKFEGSTSAGADVFDMNTSIGYDFNRFLGMDLGVPVYFVTPPSTSRLIASQSNGLGNAYMDVRLTLNTPLFDLTSTPSAAFPTGDTSKGFSTGHVAFNWDNEIERSFGRFTPFVDVDPGNGLNSITNAYTRVIQRPFITLGKEVEFIGGLDVNLLGPFGVRVDAYDVEPWGQQQVLSRILKKNTVTVKGVSHNRYYAVTSITNGSADLVKDNGYDAALDATLKHFVLLEIGYDYSVHYASGTVFFSAGFDLSRLFGRLSSH